MNWLVMWHGKVYAVNPSQQQAKQLEAAHMSFADKLLLDWVQSHTPMDISLPLVLHGSHKVILL